MSWNGHHLVGTFVAIAITGLVALKMVTVHVPADCSVSVITSLTRMPCTAASAHVPGTRTASSIIGTEAVMVAAPAPAAATRVASSCESLQEAILNGSEADIAAGMKVVIADGTVDDTSRKVARHYTLRDQGNESRQKRDVLILRDSCKP